MTNQWHNDVVIKESAEYKKETNTQKSINENAQILLQIVNEHYLLRKSINKDAKHYMLNDNELESIILMDDRFKERFTIKADSYRSVIVCLKYDVEYRYSLLHKATEELFTTQENLRHNIKAIIMIILVVLIVSFTCIKLFH